MKHSLAAAALALALMTAAVTPLGCTPEEQPLPDVDGVEAVLSLKSPDNGQDSDVAIVTWEASKDSRVQGYVIYRAEQGVGATESEKSEFTVQAVTIATQYTDDEIRTSVRYPTMRYFYRIATIDAKGIQGPQSPEVSIEYVAAG